MSAITKLKALLVLLLITCSLCENISSNAFLVSSYHRYRRNSSKTSYKSSMKTRLNKIEELSKYTFNSLSRSKDLFETLANIDHSLERLKEIQTLFDDSHKEAKDYKDEDTVRKTHSSVKKIESIETVLIKLKSELSLLRGIQDQKDKRQKFTQNIQKEIRKMEKNIAKKSKENITSQKILNSDLPNFLERKFKKKSETHKDDDNPLISRTPIQIITKMGRDCAQAAIATSRVCSTQILHYLPQTFCIKKFDFPSSPICPEGTERLFFSCQDICPPTHKKFFGICIEKCPYDYSDWGLWCHKNWFDFKGKGYSIKKIRSYLDESVKCPEGLYKFLGLCYKNCEKIGLKNYWGVCASNDTQISTEVILRLVKYVFSALKLLAFVGTLGASSAVTPTAHTALDNAVKALKENVFDFKHLYEKINQIGKANIINSALVNLGLKFMETAVTQTCKSTAESYCKHIIEKQFESFLSNKDRNIEQEKQLMSYLDIIGIEKTYNDCKDDGVSATCITSLLEKVEIFDPTGISGILSVFVTPFCKIPEDNIADSKKSALPENVWFQIVVPNEGSEENYVENIKTKCLSYNGFQKQIVLRNCNENNEEQFFTLIKREDGGYLIRNKSTLYVKNFFLRKNDENSFIIDFLPIADNYEPREFIFYIIKHGDESSKEGSEITGNPNEFKIIIQPKNSEEEDEKLCLEKTERNTLMMSDCNSKQNKHIFKLIIHPDQEKFMDIDLSETYLIKAMHYDVSELQNVFSCMESTPFFKDIVFVDCSKNIRARDWILIKSPTGGYQIINKISELPLGFKKNKSEVDNDYLLSAVVSVPLPDSGTRVAYFIPWKDNNGLFKFELILNDENYPERIFLNNNGGYINDSNYRSHIFKLETTKENADLASEYMLMSIKVSWSEKIPYCVFDKEKIDENLTFEICDETGESNEKQYWKFIKVKAPFYKIESVSRPGTFLKAVKNSFYKKNMIVLSEDQTDTDKMLWIVHAAESYISIISNFTKQCAMRNGEYFDLDDCKKYEPEFLFIPTEKSIKLK